MFGYENTPFPLLHPEKSGDAYSQSGSESQFSNELNYSGYIPGINTLQKP